MQAWQLSRDEIYIDYFIVDGENVAINIYKMGLIDEDYDTMDSSESMEDTDSMMYKEVSDE